MRVLLADDEGRVRSALKLLLEQEPGLVVGEAADGDQVLAEARAMEPDAVLLDWELPGRQARDLVSILHKLLPGLLVVALSGLPESRHAALAAGADGFVSKGDSPAQVLDALHDLGICRCG